MQIVNIGDNLHEMPKPDFSGKNKKNILYAENFTQSAKWQAETLRTKS